METKLKTVKEVAEIFGVHQKTVKRWIKNGWLKAIQIGRPYYIADGEIERAKTYGLRCNDGGSYGQ